jgi:hypothetical protein
MTQVLYLDEPNRDARGPYPIVGVTVLIHLSPTCTRHEVTQVLEFGPTRPALTSDYLRGDLVLEHPGRVRRCERAEHVYCVLLLRSDDGFLDVLVDRASKRQPQERSWGMRAYLSTVDIKRVPIEGV